MFALKDMYFRKNLFRKPEILLKIFIGLVLISAGVFRIFDMDAGRTELIKLMLPEFFLYFIILIEILLGIMLIIGFKDRFAMIGGIIFIGSAIIISLAIKGAELWHQSKELFVFDANPTDIFLHLTYMIILIYLLVKSKETLS